MEKQTAKIRDWEIRRNFGDSYQLQGRLIEHPNKELQEGSKVTTSKLVRIDFENKTAETRNTIYELA